MEPIKRVPVVQQVSENLREYIMSGEASVGDKLPTEKELCAQLNVGRATIREAFRILQATGFVEIKPGRGAFVARTEEFKLDDVIEWFAENEVELKDCVEIRTALEPLAVRLAIERCTDTDVSNIEKVHEKFLAAVQTHDATEIAKLDERFHTIITEKSRNELLISINRRVNECVKTFRSKTFVFERNVKNAIKPHNDIMNAIKARDSASGEEFMRRHLEQVLIDIDKMTESESVHNSV